MGLAYFCHLSRLQVLNTRPPGIPFNIGSHRLKRSLAEWKMLSADCFYLTITLKTVASTRQDFLCSDSVVKLTRLFRAESKNVHISVRSMPLHMRLQ
ncbi:4-hydroxybenzoate polyprenyl transferase [Moniliophthora roreri]|nr:4-hydroxybenzoate polyprenyl transferase [Moniliophthora roreri]